MDNKSNSTPKVSIIIPVYNAQEYLQECIDSVLGQSFSNIEVVLVDDGSKDDSGKICDEYASKDGRVNVIHQANAGVSVARNKGIEAANGEWIMFVDSDDFITSDAVGKMIGQVTKAECQNIIANFLEDGKGLTGNVVEFDLSEYRDGFWGGCIAGPDMFGPVYPEKLRQLPYLGTPCAKLFLRKTIVENNIRFPLDVRFGEDSIFNMYVFKYAEKVVFVDEPVYVYRKHEGSLCTSNIDKKADEYTAYVNRTEAVLEEFKAENGLNPYRAVDLSQMVWELSNLYGADAQSIKQIFVYNKLLKTFAELEPCEAALKTVKPKWVPELKHKLFVVLLKRKLYLVSILICFVFHKILKK